MEERLLCPCEVPAQGYQWIRARSAAEPKKPPQPALVEADPAVQQSEKSAPLAPVPHPALFLVFADVKPDEEGVLAFANRYGCLGLRQEIRTATAADLAQSPSMRGEFMPYWRDQISAMRRLTGLWDMVRRQDREALARHILWDAWTGGLSVYFDSHPNGQGSAPSLGLARDKKMIATETTDRDWLMRVHPDVLPPAQRHLQVEMDRELRSSPPGVGMIWNLRHPHPVLGYTCPTLLCALWMQFAAAVNDDRSFGKCRECGAFFEYSPAVARSHRRYCSTRCRTKAFRERQVRARQMHTAGKPFKEIAAELDSDVATVRQWITGNKA